MALNIKNKLANVKNWLNKTYEKIYIVIHFTLGTVDTDENNGDYFAREDTGTSCNYFTDDDSATESVPADKVAYHCGKDYSGGKAPFWGKCTNANSIGIEMCGFAKDKILDIRNKTVANTVKLTKKLMKKFNIDIDHVIRHYDVAGKNCPAPFVENELAWECFKLNCQTPFKVRTTKKNVKLRKGIGKGEIVKKYKKGKTLTVSKVYMENGKLYAKGKITKKYFCLKNTKTI
jgi:N-acetylmuramoyl-L-alanine amidase CwlA